LPDPAPGPEVAAAPVGLGDLDGWVDEASHARICGWVTDTADESRSVGLLITANGQPIGRVLANRYRPDLEAIGLGAGLHGFELVLPTALSALEAQTIRVTREADGAEMPGSPVLLPRATGFTPVVEAALADILLHATAQSDADEARAIAFLARQTDTLLTRRAERRSGRAEREARRLFRRRWGFEAPTGDAAADVCGLRALVIDDHVPTADQDAGSVAILSHMRALRTLGYAVTFVASDGLADPAGLAALASAEGVEACGAPDYSCVEDVLCRQAGGFDLIYLHRITNAEPYLPLARRRCPAAHVVYSVADLHHLRLARQAQWDKRPELLAVSARTAEAEFMAARRADSVVTHSTFEAETLRRVVGRGKVHVAPFAVPLRDRGKAFDQRSGLAFIGGCAHEPNADAVHHLASAIMPLVWRKDPSLVCKIVGHGWTGAVVQGLDARIEIVGAVEDLGALLDGARLTVAPLRFGAGIKGKVLESFGAGVPCVMTPIAAEGLPLSEALQGLVADDPAAFAALILRMHADREANESLGRECSELIAREYSAERVVEALRWVRPAEREAQSSPA
jgi:glycosyltransferase involved in cell wall biosynthesis